MINEPLNANEHLKLIIFCVLCIPSIFTIVGIIPMLFLAYGYFMMKKNTDFSHVEASFKLVNLLLKLGIIFPTLFIIAGANEAMHSYAIASRQTDSSKYTHYSYDDSIWMVLIGLFILIIIFVYIAILKNLYFKTLKNHSQWVSKNGTFANKPKLLSTVNDDLKTNIDILQSEKLKPYSVADELQKWAKLKEDGHITEVEFDEARAKLLNRT